MKLYGRNLSPYTRRVAVCLDLLDVPHERIYLSPWSADQAAQIAASNPLVRVPFLVLDDGETLLESGAIIDHVMEIAGPAKSLVPPAGKARRDCLRLAAIGTGLMDKGVNAFYERTKRPADKVHAPWHDHLTRQVSGGLALLEAQPMSPWLQGERPTLADVTAAVAFTFLGRTNPALVPPGAYPRLEALTARAEALPAFRKSPLEQP